jgi:hypothetical protein
MVAFCFSEVLVFVVCFTLIGQIFWQAICNLMYVVGCSGGVHVGSLGRPARSMNRCARPVGWPVGWPCCVISSAWSF